MWMLQRLEALTKEASGKAVKLVHCLDTVKLGKSKWMGLKRELELKMRMWEECQGTAVMIG